MNRRSGFIVLVPLLFSARLAWAGDATAKDRAALTACLSGDYAKGVALLTELFVDSKEPTYLYNQGRCYEQNRRYEDAIARFQEYLRAGRKLSKAERADAQKHIADCKELLASQPAASVTPVAPSPGPLPVPMSAPAVVPPPSPPAVPILVQQPTARPSRETGSGLRTTGIITAAAGGAALVAAVVLNLKVNSMADDLQKTDGYSDSEESDRKTYATLGWASYGVGAVCVATGAVLYVLGLRSAGSGSAAIGFAPTLASGQAGAVVEGAF